MGAEGAGAKMDGCVYAIKKGSWSNGLFEIKCPGCLMNWCCYCFSLKEIHEKLKVDSHPSIATCLCAPCCALCFMVSFGKKFKGPLEPFPLALFKAWCCGPCYIHQQYKEDAAMTAVAGAASQAASLVGARMSPGQQEMK
mmetsp:Transcript_8331/g.15203  ORF Transcript_8331/g.15203 Transcript_8331/m.15203 type:complete len:140 (-) Transcript_8331:202-621(-)